MALQLRAYVFNKMAENACLVWDDADGTALLVDPGCASEAELAQLEADLEGLRPAAILVTHPHFDHLAGGDAPDVPFRFFPQGPQSLQFGGITVQVLPLGGHTAGSVAYYFPDAGAVCVGDTVTKGSLGFLEMGYRETLDSIRDYLLPLPDDTLMLAGHGEASTIGEERRGNRFFIRCCPPGRNG